MAVALPLSSCRRQTKPGAASAIALTGSSCATKPAIRGASIGASRRPTFSCARWWPGMGRSNHLGALLSILICFRTDDDAALARPRVEPDRAALLPEPREDALDQRSAEPADQGRALARQLVERTVAGPQAVVRGVRLEA